MTLTPAQIRAGLGLLGMTQKDLSEITGITRANLNKYNNGTANPTTSTMNKIEDFFDNMGIRPTTNGGYEFKPHEEIKKLYGRYGFITFMDDVYKVINEHGGEICVSNVDERNWIKWMTGERYQAHSDRMSELEGFNFKIFVENGDDFLFANEIAEYRHIPTEFFTDQSFYVYGDKLALIAFEDDDVRINIIGSARWAESFRRLFNFAWENAPRIEN